METPVAASSVPYILLLLLAAVLSAAVAVYGWHRRHVPGARAFVLLMVGVAVWALAYAFELQGDHLPTKLVWAKLEYLGIVTVPLAWLVFAAQYAGRARWLTPRAFLLLALVPLATLLLAWTNEAHGLIWSRVGLQATAPFVLLELAHGPWFWVHIGFSYGALLLGTGLLSETLLRSPRFYRPQAGAMLVAVLAPWLGNILYVTQLGPVPGLDWTPFAFTLSGLALGWNLFRLHWLDLFVGLIPVARDAIIEGMPDGVLVLDRDQRIVDLNPAAQQLIGRPAADVIGRPAGQVLANWPAVVTSPDSTERHAEMTLSTGTALCHYDLLISPLQPAGGTAGRLVVIRDITDRKRAEEGQRFLAQASAHLVGSLDYATTLANVAHLAVPVLADWCTIDLVKDDGAIERVAAVHADSAKQALMDDLQARAPDPASRHPLLQVLHTGRSVLYREIADDALSAAVGDADHFRLVRALGIASCLIVPLRAHDRTLGTMMLVLGDSGRRYDVADLALAEELARRAALAVDNARLHQEVQAALQARDHFFSVAAHELKTPMTAIKGNAQLLLRTFSRGRVDPQQATRLLTTINHVTDRLVLLTNDLLDLSRLRLGQLPLDLQPVDLAALAHATARSFSDHLGEHHRLTVEVRCEPCPVLADVDRLEQVLTNLLDNAVKYSPDGGTIGISLEADSTGAILSVQDQGIGLPPGAAATIFEPFERAANAVAGPASGLGLGLYISRTIIERHGGRIWADSAGEGRGTRISVWLPRNTAGEQSQPDG